jgi:chaperone required for assembly of F1-ATPase
MKRFYDKSSARATDAGYDILLDGRPVRTPAKEPLLIPNAALAEAITAEWNAQGDKVDPRSMPLTGLANAAIDRVGPERDAFVRALAVYGETDLLCYRAETPEELVARQEEGWDPLLAWARYRFDVDFEIAYGIVHKPQPVATIERLRNAVETRDSFALAAVSPLVTISGSLVIALALAESAIDLEGAWAAATLDESWQTEKWGEDFEATRTLEARRREFDAAHHFLKLLA